MSEQRYIRQLQVKPFGPDALEKLSSAQVLIVGCGGLGSPVSLYLAGAGVGELILVDPDHVSLSNLHRQILFTESDLDLPKARLGAKRLQSLNSEINIQAHCCAVTPANVDKLVAQATLVIDAADNFFVSYLLSDCCSAKRIPLVAASVIETSGHIGVFCGTQDKPLPSLRALFPNPPAQAQNCSTAGVTGPAVGIIGSYQAQEALKVILGDEHQLAGRLMYLDLWNYRQQIIDFSDAKEPEDYAEFLAYDQLTANHCLLDVRSAQEYRDEPLPKTESNIVNIPVVELQDRYQELDITSEIVCVCKSGLRALNAARILIEQGHHQQGSVFVTLQ